MNTVAVVEEGARQLADKDVEDLWGRVCGILRRVKLSKDNLTVRQRMALKELRALEDEMVLPADKGNTTVIMTKEDYDTKLRRMLESSTYKRLKGDPTTAQESKLSCKLKNLEKSGDIPTRLYHELRPSGSQPPRIYGLPKGHKPEVLLRPIVSCIGSPSYRLSRFITSLISPLGGKMSTHVKNSRHFLEAVKGVRVTEDELLVSFDVSSLFTNVPIDEAVQVI